MNYVEYEERVGKDFAENGYDYDFVVEPYYMALSLDKDEFCKFIQTKGGQQAMKKFHEMKSDIIEGKNLVKDLEKKVERLQCLLTRDQDKEEYEEAKRVYDLLGNTMVDEELRAFLQKKMEYFQNRLSK